MFFARYCTLFFMLLGMYSIAAAPLSGANRRIDALVRHIGCSVSDSAVLAQPIAALSEGPLREFNQNVQKFGNKTANLQVLEHLSAYLSQQVNKKLTVKVPPFLGVDHGTIEQFLQQNGVDIKGRWKYILSLRAGNLRMFPRDNGKKLTDMQIRILANMRENIIKAFEKNIFSFSTLQAQLDAWKQEYGDYTLMVRSTGREDTEQCANAGGNESVAAVRPTLSAISAAIGVVVASYFSERSLNQRLSLGDDIYSAPFMPVLIQVMIGETKGKKPPVSGVLYTSDGMLLGATVIHTTFGHNEGIVNNTVVADEYHIGLSGVVHEIIREKSQRLVPENSKLVLVANDRLMQKASSLKGYESALKMIAEKVESYYGMPMDLEFTIDRESNTIYLVQARPLSHKTKQSMPSYTASIVKIPFLSGTVIVPASGTVQYIDNANQIIIEQTLADAYRKYFSLSNQTTVRALVVGTMAASTSHEAAQFNSLNIPVIYTEHTERLSSLVKAGELLVIDVQREVIIYTDKQSIASIRIQQGWYSYPVPLACSVTIPTTAEQLENKKFIDEFLKNKLFFESIVPLRVLLEKLITADEQMALKALRTIIMRLQKELFFMRFKKASESLVNEQFLILNNAALLARKEIIPALRHPKKSLERLYAVRFLEALLYQESDMYKVNTYSLKSVIQEYKVQKGIHVSADINVQMRDFAGQYAKIGAMAFNKNIQQAWNMCVHKLMQSSDKELHSRCAHMVMILQKSGALGLWLNTSFIQAWNSTRDALKTLQTVTEEFARDSEKIRKVTDKFAVIQQWRMKIPLWAYPAAIDALIQQFNDSFIPVIESFITSLQENTGITKLLEIQAFKETIDVFDLTIKSVTGSSLYKLEAKINYFTRCLRVYDCFLNRVIDSLLDYGLTLNLNIDNARVIHDYIDRFSREISWQNLQASDYFNVAAAQMDSRALFVRHAPKTLEDCFTLIHQNLLIVSGIWLKKSGIGLDMLPDHVHSVVNALQSTKTLNTINFIGLEYTYPLVTLSFNQAMRNHSGSYQIKYSVNNPDLVTLAVTVFDRNDMTILAEFINMATLASGLTFQKNGEAVYDAQRKTFSHTWDIPLNQHAAQALFCIPKIMEKLYHIAMDHGDTHGALFAWICKELPCKFTAIPSWFYTLNSEWHKTIYKMYDYLLDNETATVDTWISAAPLHGAALQAISRFLHDQSDIIHLGFFFASVPDQCIEHYYLAWSQFRIKLQALMTEEMKNIHTVKAKILTDDKQAVRLWQLGAWMQVEYLAPLLELCKPFLVSRTLAQSVRDLVASFEYVVNNPSRNSFIAYEKMRGIQPRL